MGPGKTAGLSFLALVLTAAPVGTTIVKKMEKEGFFAKSR
jgi:hypothetical protein